MAAKFFFILCVSAHLVKTIIAYPGCGCALAGGELAATDMARAELAAANFGGSGYAPQAYSGVAEAEIVGAEFANYGASYGYLAPSYAAAPVYANPSIASNNGGSFIVSMSSPIIPTGVTVLSENTIDGTLEVVGSLPLLATVTLEGSVPSCGGAATSYGCGSGSVGISSESLAAAGLGPRLSDARIVGAELVGFNTGLAGDAGYGAAGYGPTGLSAAVAGAELAGINSGLTGFTCAAGYGPTGFGPSITSAELGSINAGRAGAAGYGPASPSAVLTSTDLASINAELANARYGSAPSLGIYY